MPEIRPATLVEECLQELHPVHFIVDTTGDLLVTSVSFRTEFPIAQNIRDFLAPNSADELLALIQNMIVAKQARASLDLFSIQHYTIFYSHIVSIKQGAAWLIYHEDGQKQQSHQPIQLDAKSIDVNHLLERNEFYEALLHQLPAEVAVFDPDFKFLFVNRSAIKNEELRKWLMGRSEIEYWKSKNLPLDKALNRIHAFKEAVDSRKLTAVEEIFHPGTENEKHYIRVTNPYFEKDKLRFLLTYGVDITALKKTENQLIQQNTELEKVNAELDQFVYSASHNLRAPLLSIKGLLNLITLSDTDATDRNRFMSEVFKSIERLDSTIHDIIEYSKNARLDIEPVAVNLEELVQETAEDLRFYESMNVEIIRNFDIQVQFYSDLRRIKSILHNIMSNSVKYADTAKTKRWIKIDMSVSEQYCRMTFTDNGIGIAPENLDRVFEMFYRGTSQRNGSGLGLYIVKEMVQKIGGTIELHSNLGEGTRFHLELPNLEWS